MLNRTFLSVAMALGCATVMANFGNERVPPQQGLQGAAAPAVQVNVASIHHKVNKGSLPDSVIAPLKVGQKMLFGLVMTNTSSDPIKVLIFDTYAQNRPQLFRNGQLVEYRQEIGRLLAAKEEPSEFDTRVAAVVLQPNSPEMPETIDLAQWYDPLPPDHYQLNLRHRFYQGQKWVDCSSVTFDVIR